MSFLRALVCDFMRRACRYGNSFSAQVFRRFSLASDDLAVIYQIADNTSDLPSAQPSRVAIDETAVQVGTDWYWLYAAIDLDSKLLLGVRLSQRRGTRG